MQVFVSMHPCPSYIIIGYEKKKPTERLCTRTFLTSCIRNSACEMLRRRIIYVHVYVRSHNYNSYSKNSIRKMKEDKRRKFVSNMSHGRIGKTLLA